MLKALCQKYILNSTGHITNNYKFTIFVNHFLIRSCHPICTKKQNCLFTYLRHRCSMFYNMICWWLEDDNFATILNKLFDCHPYGSIPSYTTNKYSCISKNLLQTFVKQNLHWTKMDVHILQMDPIFFYPYKTIMLFVKCKECQMDGITTFVV